MLIVAAYHHWSHRAETYGIEEAMAISRFESAHPAAFRALANKYNLVGDVRELEAVDAFYDRDLFERASKAASEITEHVPEIAHKFYTAKEAQAEFLLSSECVGAITYRVGQLDSYKLVTQLAEILVNKGMNLQTQTPVTNVSYDLKNQKWRIQTPRGDILGSQVVHATNGYINYLVPLFETIIRPCRAHVTAQVPPQSLSVSPLGRAYCFIYAHGEFDYLTQQHPHDGGKLLLGGGFYEDVQPYTHDDSETSEHVRRYLAHQLREVVQWGGANDPGQRTHMLWSGIMGFSADELPWVGSLPKDLGGGEGQWICGGYTGEGNSSALYCLTVRNVQCVTVLGSISFYGSWERAAGVFSSVLFAQYQEI